MILPSLFSRNHQLFHGSLRYMMNALFIPIIGNGSAGILQNNLFIRSANSQYKHGHQIFRNLQSCLQLLFLKASDHAAAQSLFHCRQQHGLSRNPHIPQIRCQILTDSGILTDNNKSRRTFSLCRKMKLRQCASPFGQRLDLLYYLRLPCQKILQRLYVRRRRTQTGTCNQLPQLLLCNFSCLIISPVAPVFL